MTFTNLDSLPSREIVPGFHGQMIHTDNTTVAQWAIDEGAALPAHAHPHEQVTLVLEGTFEMTVGGETRRLQAGDAAVIPGGVAHAGRAITACRVLDVFNPARDDYRQA